MAAIALSHKSCEENREICERLIEERDSETKFQDRRLIDTDKIIEAFKVSNKQWESAISFMVSSYWTKSEILELQGKFEDSKRNYEQLISYFDSKLGEEVW